ncbi:uncharacterized protein LOC108913828 [Anoplophora glabripennis]|uniref:uncharacterized protein LOC108913828 n=1 Tax=Anoplophora glabripennis TaxID=217634 RepID=UPI00087400FE|nr:uncharacterized protein LOC108913828 [Anoplophora glabripennis]
MMSPKVQVLPLSYLCLKVVSNQLIYALSDEEGKYYEVVEKYFLAATYEVLQDLLKIILNSVNLDASIRYACLEVLLREDVKKLDTGIFPQFYYRKILETIAYKGKRLQQLNMKGVWVRDYPEQLCKMIRRLKHLKTLTIPHMADDSIIDEVLNLKKLTMLDICGEACYTVGGIRKLKSDTLRVLDIGNFGKIDLCQEEISGYELVAQIIEQLPNLISIRTYSYTGSALWLIYNKNPKYRSKLMYLHDTRTTLETMDSIIKLCPDLESIHLDTPESGVMEKLSQLRKLNSLKLIKPSLDEVINYLKVSGTQLQVLKLNHNKKFSLDLSQICLLVPNLQTVECFQMKLTFTNLNTYSMALQNVELLYCDMSDHVVRYILTNAPFLKRMVVGCVINMTDGDIFRLCAECNFQNLEELWFSCARCLTATSVELLMGHCPNLRVIGQLNGWDMHQDELDYLRAIIAATNTDLTLLPVGNFL